MISGQVRQALGEEDVEHPEEQEGVAARPDRNVLGRARRGLGATRVDDNDGAAPLYDVAQPMPGAWRAHQRAVRDGRVGAEDEEVVRAVDVGDGEQAEVPEHLGGGAVLRKLIRGSRR